MGTVCDCDARRYDVPVDRAFFANVDSLRRSNVAVDRSQHDHDLGKHLGLDPAVRPDSQHVISQFDRALDRPFHSQVFAAAQLAFHDDRFADGDDGLTIAGGWRRNVATAGGSQVNYCGNAATFSWSDGAPNASGSTDNCGLYVAGTGGSFRITVPADTTTHTLYVYFGVWYAAATVTAVLGDQSAAAYSDTSLANSGGTTNRRYAISYTAQSPGQALTVSITITTAYSTPYGPGNATLGAAALA